MVSSNGNSVAQKFGYNGKELNEELGLDGTTLVQEIMMRVWVDG